MNQDHEITVLDSTRPEERILVEAYVHPQKSSPEKDSALGFGLETELALLLPSILLFLKEVAEGAAKKIGESIGERTVSLISHQKTSTLGVADLRFLGEALQARLLREGFESAEAQKVSDSLIAVLVENPEALRHMVGS